MQANVRPTVRAMSGARCNTGKNLDLMCVWLVRTYI